MDYSAKIREDLDFLLAQEKQQPKAFERDRIRFLRLLKSGECRTPAAAGAIIGLSERQAQRLWHEYRQGGFEQLVTNRKKGYWGRLSSVQLSQLRQFLLTDQAQTLADIQTFLKETFQEEYTIGGISDLCKRLKVKAKKDDRQHSPATGRRRGL